MTAPHYVILGAGITGLVQGYQLKKKEPNAKITVMEKSHRVGGWIESRHCNGFLCEMGPRSFRPQGKGLRTLELIQELGLQSEVIKPDPAAKIRYLYEEGSLRALPYGLGSLLLSPLLPLLIKAAWRDFRVARGCREDESIFAFAERHFGVEVAERLVDPLTLGIYASDCRQLSIQACFPFLAESEQSHGSLLRAAFASKKQAEQASPWIADMQKEPFLSFKQGMETLVHALKEKLDGHIQLNSAACGLNFLPRGVEILQENKPPLFADHVYSTLSTGALSSLLAGIPTTSASSVAVVSLGFDKRVLKQKGFGYLVPSREKETILGMVWDSSAFPQQNNHDEQTRLTVMIDAKKPQDFVSIALDALKRHLHIATAPDHVECKVAFSAIPRYAIGHRQTSEEIKSAYAKQTPHLTLMGTHFHGVSINDCISSAS